MIVEKYGDMRVQMGYQIINMWFSLGESSAYRSIYTELFRFRPSIR